MGGKDSEGIRSISKEAGYREEILEKDGREGQMTDLICGN